jgi:hypothetical protein
MRKGIIALIAAVAFPPLLALAAYIYAGEHRILPGLKGCAIIRETGPEVDCVADELRATAADDDVEIALAAFDEQVQDGAVRSGVCHLAAHQLGEKAGARAAQDKDPFPELEHDGFCSQGYDHGFYIAYLDESRPSAVHRQIATRCEGLDSKKAQLSCVHAFGHSLAREKGLSDGETHEVCGQIEIGNKAVTENARFECSFAVYMEYSLEDFDGERTGKAENCSAKAGPATEACYAFLPSRLFEYGRSDADVAKTCGDAPSPRAAELCAESLGVETGDAEACEALPPEYREACRTSATGTV